MNNQIKNLKRATIRIKKAVKNKERIVLYGDSDLDGITSTIILKETIRNLGGDVAGYYFPDRESDGYGINKNGLKFMKKMAPALFISMDLGITNFKEIDLANKMGNRIRGNVFLRRKLFTNSQPQERENFAPSWCHSL